MSVAIDSVALTLLLRPSAGVPRDPATGESIVAAADRIVTFLEQEATAGMPIIVPTPALAEVLVLSGAAGLGYVEQLQASGLFAIADFDTRAAIELAEMTRAALSAGDKRAGSDAPWQKIKLDRQIAAIAKVAGATRLLTNDLGLAKFATACGLGIVRLQDLPVPPEQPTTPTAPETP